MKPKPTSSFRLLRAPRLAVSWADPPARPAPDDEAAGMAQGPSTPPRQHPPSAAEPKQLQGLSSNSSSGSTQASPIASLQALGPAPRRWRRLPPKLLLVWLAVATAVFTHAVWAGQIGWGHRRPLVWPLREPSHRANLVPLTVLDQSPDTCAEALRIPKVALLFLTQGLLPHERTWGLWFQAAEGRLPVEPLLVSGACNGSARGSRAMQQVRAACAPGRELLEGGSPAAGLSLQHLFSVYVHVPDWAPGFPPTSLFGGEGTVIAERVPTAWGSHTLVEAMRALLWAAARDPANQRFVLLSESDVPLYDPLTFHAQLMAENRSRINACLPTERNQTMKATSLWRWTPRMQFNRTYWRKSSQWFTLTRGHAEAVLEDEEVFRAFETHCWSGWVTEFQRYRDCFSDEHYLPTLLAVRGLEGECACEAWRGPTYLEWGGWGPHPRAFRAEDINASLIQRARGEGNSWQNCSAAAVQADAARMYVRYEDLLGDSRGEVCRRLAGAALPTLTRPLDATCAVTARKFPGDTADAVYGLFAGCEGARLGLLEPESSDTGNRSNWGCEPGHAVME